MMVSILLHIMILLPGLSFLKQIIQTDYSNIDNEIIKLHNNGPRMSRGANA